MNDQDLLMQIAGPAVGALSRLRERLATTSAGADIYLAYAGTPLKMSGFLVCGKGSIDSVIAYCPLPPGLDPTSDEWGHETLRQWRIAVRVAEEPFLAKHDNDLIWLGFTGTGSREVPTWVYALACLPLTYAWDGKLVSPRPFCHDLFTHMAAQPQALRWLTANQPPKSLGSTFPRREDNR